MVGYILKEEKLIEPLIFSVQTAQTTHTYTHAHTHTHTHSVIFEPLQFN